MNDHNGRQIDAGDFVRHVYEPAPARVEVMPGLGPHCHDFFGVARVSELLGSVVIVAKSAGGARVSSSEASSKSSKDQSATGPTSCRWGSP